VNRLGKWYKQADEEQQRKLIKLHQQYMKDMKKYTKIGWYVVGILILLPSIVSFIEYGGPLL
jgi:lysozyme family protein